MSSFVVLIGVCCAVLFSAVVCRCVVATSVIIHLPLCSPTCFPSPRSLSLRIGLLSVWSFDVFYFGDCPPSHCLAVSVVISLVSLMFLHSFPFTIYITFSGIICSRSLSLFHCLLFFSPQFFVRS